MAVTASATAALQLVHALGTAAWQPQPTDPFVAFVVLRSYREVVIVEMGPEDATVVELCRQVDVDVAALEGRSSAPSTALYAPASLLKHRVLDGGTLAGRGGAILVSAHLEWQLAASVVDV